MLSSTTAVVDFLKSLNVSSVVGVDKHTTGLCERRPPAVNRETSSSSSNADVAYLIDRSTSITAPNSLALPRK